MMLFTNVKHECNIDRLIDVYFLQKYWRLQRIFSAINRGNKNQCIQKQQHRTYLHSK
jgi:hypothetical protein